MGDDYRQILGVSPNATLEEIKGAFRREAKLHHPDKDPSPLAEERFKKISKAYKILSEIAQQESASKVVKHKSRRGSDLSLTVHVAVEELIACASKVIAIRRTGLCGVCKGTGAKEKTTQQCIYCGGVGTQGMARILGLHKACSYCEGAGRIPVGSKCDQCHGKGIFPEVLSYRLELNPYSDVLVIPGYGNFCAGGTAGNLIIEIEVDRTSAYNLSGLDIMGPITLTPAQAVLGDTIKLNALGKAISIRIPAGVQNGQVVEQEHGGVEYKNRTGCFKGKIRVKVPQIISQEEEQLYRQILKLENIADGPRTLKL